MAQGCVCPAVVWKVENLDLCNISERVASGCVMLVVVLLLMFVSKG
jgi:hypothetical protein